jgi:O-acetyl-ADP-ribose deacetylase (regulator of RNase III)
MVRYVTTSLFSSPAQTLVNTVNTVGVMGKGIAAEFKHRYPDMFRLYRRFCQEGQFDVGRLYVYRSPNKWVLNFPTKTDWRLPSRPEYVRQGLEKFVQTYVAQGITSISFPQLGCGNGGLDWEGVVRPMMEDYLSKVAIPIYVHVTHPQRGFVAEHLDRQALRDLRQPREHIPFAKFLMDLRRTSGVAINQNGAGLVRADADEEALALPSIPIGSNGGGELVPGEFFEDLWHELSMTGTARLDGLPPHLREATLALLLKLPYVEPISFQDSQGIRLSLAASSEPEFASVALSNS